MTERVTTDAPARSSAGALAPDRPPGSAAGRVRRGLLAAALLGSSAGIIVAVYVALYPTDPHTSFAGFATPWYVWRGKIAALEGLDALVGSVTPPFRAQAFRAGYPLLAGFAHSVARVPAVELIFAFPAVMGAVIGLAAGAFGFEAARDPRWSFPIYAIAVGVSIHTTLTAVDHLENLMVTGLVLGAATAAVLVARRRPALAAAVLLLGSGALIHWSIAAFFAGLLLVLAALLGPRSLRAARRGARLIGTPSARLATAVVGAAALGGGALLLLPEAPVLPGRGPELFLDKAWRDLARVAPVAVVAVGGVLAYLRPKDPRRRTALALALIWALSPVAVFVLATFVRAPMHRLLAFAFGLPLLASAAVVAASRLPSRVLPRAAGVVLGTAVAAGALVGGAALAEAGWRDPPEIRAIHLGQAETAGRYLQEVGGSRPVVFVIDPVSPRPHERIRLHFDLIRSALPAEQIRRTHPYVGTVDDLLAGRPTLRPGDPPYNAVSLAHWEGMREVLEDDPIVLALRFANREQPPPEGTLLAPGVTLMRGPDPQGPPQAEQPLFTRPDLPQHVAAVGALLGLLAVVGLGWSASLLPVGWTARAALAPAMGLAALMVGGALANGLGFGAPGSRVGLVVLLSAAGWLGAAVRWRRRRGGGPGGTTEPG